MGLLIVWSRKKELFDGMVEMFVCCNICCKNQFFIVEFDVEFILVFEMVVSMVIKFVCQCGVVKFIEYVDEVDEVFMVFIIFESDYFKFFFDKKVKINGVVEKEEKIVDGWKFGMDFKVDFLGEYEFGGFWFVFVMMIGFFFFMWYMWIGVEYYDGKFFFLEVGQFWIDFGKYFYNFCYIGVFFYVKVWVIYWIFFVVEGVMYCLMFGVWVYGKFFFYKNGEQFRYYCLVYVLFYIIIVFVVGFYFFGIFLLYIIFDEFGFLFSVFIFSGWLVLFIVYFLVFYCGVQYCMFGNYIYDFFMGVEFNFCMFGIFDFKMFFEVCMFWYILFFLLCVVVVCQWDQYGYVFGEVGFLVFVYYFYGNVIFKGEELIVFLWDMYYEKWGFMLIFWNLFGVFLLYCYCILYFVNYDFLMYRWNRYFLVVFYVVYLFVYWVWDMINSQKNVFRVIEKGKLVKCKMFFQLLWQVVKNFKVIEMGLGDKILVDGWYGKVRKIYYSCDMFFVLSWGLIIGFESLFLWFYGVFFMIMIVYRVWRDIYWCREKYGEVWKEYERQVFYLFILVSLIFIL